MGTETEKMVEIIDHAMVLLRQGWIRGRMNKVVDGVECFCASGALLASAISADHEQCERLYYGVRDQIEMILSTMNPNYDSLVLFNDHTANDVEDVLEVFRKTKERLLAS